MSIPRIIHQIWIGENLPPVRCMESWRKMNPGWEYRLWGNTDLELEDWELRRQHEQMKEVNGIADCMRYEILFHHGGILVDADSECVRPLDDAFLQHVNFACYEHEELRKGLIAAGYVGAIKGSGLMRHCIDEIKKSDASRGMAWQTVGPALLTSVARERAKKYPNELYVYPARTFIPVHYSGQPAPGDSPIYAKQKWGSTVGYDIINDVAVSVVIPAYNAGVYLNEAVESILNQTYDNWELIIGCSSLDDLSRASRYNDRRIRAIFIEPKGLSFARNECIKEAQGKYVVCLDADDRLQPTCLWRCVLAAAHLQKQKPGAPVIVSVDLQEFGGRQGHWDLGPERPILQHNCFPYCSLYSRELWQKTGGYDVSLPWREDWSFWISCAEHEPSFAHISERLLEYRIHANQLSQGETDSALSDALVRLRHAGKYPKAKMLEDIKTVAEMGEKELAALKRRHEWFPDDANLCAWLSLVSEERGLGRNDAMEKSAKPALDRMEEVLKQ